MLPRPPTASIPDEPGCYQFFDAEGRCLYVGKAKRLRDRVSTYFTTKLAPRTAQMVQRAARVEWVCVPTERDALVLEANLIKSLDPEYNIKLREDYPYAFVVLDSRRHATRITTWRGAPADGVERFGPYVTAGGARGVVDAITSFVPLRPCSDAKFAQHRRAGKGCLLADVGRCAAPCVAPDGDEGYAQLVETARRALNGESNRLRSLLHEEMTAAAATLQYERAALCRDRLAALENLRASQLTVPGGGDCDVFGVAEQYGTFVVQVLKVRNETVVEAPSFLVELPPTVGDLGPVQPGELVAAALTQRYAHEPAPAVICVPELPVSLPPEILAAHPTRRVPRVVVPRRGPKRALLEMASSNAQQALIRLRTRRAADLDARRAELAGLQSALGLSRFPLRIEAVDVSHLQGTATVSVISCLVDGLPRPALYRRYRLADHGGDDYAAMREVLTRRFARKSSAPTPSLEESDGSANPSEALATRAALDRSGLPDLLVIDGGPAQLAVAVEVLDAAGLLDHVPVVSLAKRFEEVYLPGRPDPVILARTSPELLLLARARDETHAASSRFQQKISSARLRSSPLEKVSGLGPARRRRLLAEAGSLTALRQMSREDLERFTFLPARTRDALFELLHPEV